MNESYLQTESQTAIGLDVGASLAKLSMPLEHGGTANRLFSSFDLPSILTFVKHINPSVIGLTGGRANAFKAHIDTDVAQINEFSAWGMGASSLLSQQGLALEQPYLLVSVGTGTSIMCVSDDAVTRVGGTAMGGGTLMGLATTMLGVKDFHELLQLAEQGERSQIDLLVSDLYRDGEIGLAGDLTASNFGKMSRPQQYNRPQNNKGHSKADLAHALIGMVAENIALLSASQAKARQISQVIFAGTTLKENPRFTRILTSVCGDEGVQAHLLQQGEFVGSLGALSLATTIRQ